MKIGEYTYGKSLNIHGSVRRVSKRQRLPTTVHPDARILALKDDQHPPWQSRKRETDPLPPLQHSWVDLSIELQNTSCSSGDGLVPALPVLDQVSEEVFFHSPGLSSTYFSNGIDSCGDDFAPDARMDELCGEFPDDGGQRVWGCEVVYALCERDEDGWDAELVVCEVFEDISVERDDEELVSAHDTGKELHEEDLVVERKSLVVPTEAVVEPFGKGLWIVEELQGRKVGVGGGNGCLLLFL